MAPLAVSDLGNGQILIVVALLAFPIAAIAFAGIGSALKTMGKGPWAIDQDIAPSRGLTSSAATPVDKRVRDAEIRQMLEAKSYRRQQRGEEPLDIEAEMERLLAPPKTAGSSFDEGIREEVRQLVIARNARRMRQGKQPLDVAEEIERQLAELEGLGH